MNVQLKPVQLEENAATGARFPVGTVTVNVFVYPELPALLYARTR